MKENINEIVELLNQYLQMTSGSMMTQYFRDGDKWCYETEDGEVLNSSEDGILEEVQACWDAFLMNIAYKVNRFSCNADDGKERAWGALIDNFTDHEETVMERCLLDNMTTEQRAEAYKQYIEGEFYDEVQKLQVMLQY